MKINPLHIVVLLLLTLSVGCGSNVSVTGKVALPDGTPLTEGTVVFQNDKMIARGHIQQDGSYSLVTGEAKGIPKGTYEVSISGFGVPRMEPVPGTGGPRSGPQMRPVFTPSPIDKKYYSGLTSGLTCEVKGKMVHNITVTPPE